ncbi:ABC transporter permease [Reichenbachiella sp. 5M10]|uniref:MlaE family ABC transporter permease n=1 Tax=Reichenbachiella sp. 5M10 TaxID=1889772 RepID=UPI000C158CEE|nr:ABC transporter permease [Reichenbachiella sp. 5M10]PIB36482.1 ABC transporter permease [Reichenbachiella sp. 5M10]
MRSFGRFILFISSMFVRRESFMTYVKLVFEECTKIGVNSIFLVAIVSTFIGAVTTLQTAYNLVSPFIPPYVISMVVRDMTILELAPTVMAIVYAGKVGSNIAGELGSMRITEQIDALEVMGINASSYLVLPKIIASLITYPMLVVISAFLSLVGGYLAGTLAGVITPTEYIYGIRYEFVAFNITFALTKAYVFAFLVAAISAYKGFFTSGGALEVGVASTSAVTNSCIAILCADFLLTNIML